MMQRSLDCIPPCIATNLTCVNQKKQHMQIRFWRQVSNVSRSSLPITSLESPMTKDSTWRTAINVSLRWMVRIPTTLQTRCTWPSTRWSRSSAVEEESEFAMWGSVGSVRIARGARYWQLLLTSSQQTGNKSTNAYLVLFLIHFFNVLKRKSSYSPIWLFLNKVLNTCILIWKTLSQ